MAVIDLGCREVQGQNKPPTRGIQVKDVFWLHLPTPPLKHQLTALRMSDRVEDLPARTDLPQTIHPRHQPTPETARKDTQMTTIPAVSDYLRGRAEGYLSCAGQFAELAAIPKGATEVLGWLDRHGPLTLDELVALRARTYGPETADDHNTTRTVLFDLWKLMDCTLLIEFDRAGFHLRDIGQPIFRAYSRMSELIPGRPGYRTWGEVLGDPDAEQAALDAHRAGATR